MVVVLRAASLASRVHAAGGKATPTQERHWTSEALAAQKLLISRIAVQGVQIRPDYSYSRVMNGFSAVLDPRAVALLEKAPDVQGVYPVRAAYPAAVSDDRLARRLLAPGFGHRPEVGLNGFDGRGVTIALLDTGVDSTQPYLQSRVGEGIDLVGGEPVALAASKPDNTGELEGHGTEMAGLLVGGGGPDGLTGVAPGATVLPIRIAGWQQDATGGWAVYSRTDQIVAGLDRAVDPNDDGDAHDAARVALVALAEPFAAFADGPSARAVDGATALDTLVVTPAGNDGAAGPGYGSISGPGGAPGALTVGAADLRRQTERVRVVLRAGLDVVFDQVAPLGGAIAPRGPLSLRVATPRPAEKSPPLDVPAASLALARFFDRRGYSLVAGRAALVAAGDNPDEAARSAARAGAAAVLLYGERLPPGALGLEDNVGVPVVGLDTHAARLLLDALNRRAVAAVSIGKPRIAANAGRGRVAAFSSTGLAFDGRVKPELVAPGVGLATSQPGETDDGRPRYGTVNGTSAAAATVAGAAAVLAQARPSLDAPALKSALSGYARPIGDDPVTAEGAGLLDLGAAAAGEVAVEPASLALGNATGPRWRKTETLLVRNLSTRPIRLRVGVEHGAEGAAAVTFVARPHRLSLLTGQAAPVQLEISLKSAPVGSAPAEGAVVVRATGAGAMRVPWAITFATGNRGLLETPRLSTVAFAPSDSAPARLTLQAGRVLGGLTGDSVRAVSRLDIELRNAKGTNLGLLARLRDVLPGTYAFGLTGRDPAGAVLPNGRYRLRIAAYPTGPGPISRRNVAFRIR